MPSFNIWRGVSGRGALLTSVDKNLQCSWRTKKSDKKNWIYAKKMREKKLDNSMQWLSDWRLVFPAKDKIRFIFVDDLFWHLFQLPCLFLSFHHSHLHVIATNVIEKRNSLKSIRTWWDLNKIWWRNLAAASTNWIKTGSELSSNASNKQVNNI